MTECSFMDFEKEVTAEDIARNIRKAICSTLISIIDHNRLGPKPHHKNKDIMKALLQMEAKNG